MNEINRRNVPVAKVRTGGGLWYRGYPPDCPWKPCFELRCRKLPLLTSAFASLSATLMKVFLLLQLPCFCCGGDACLGKWRWGKPEQTGLPARYQLFIL